MLCAKCGSFVPDGANVCGVCGQPVAAPAPKKKLNVKVLVIAGVAVVAVVALCLVLFGGSSYSGLVDDYYEYYYEGEIPDLEDMAPQAYWDAVQKLYKVTPDVIEDDAKLEAKLEADRVELDADYAKDYGSDFDIDWSVTCDHEVTSEVLGEIKESLLKKYNITVEEARLIHVKIEKDGELNSSISINDKYAVKIDGDWYLLDSGYGFVVEDIISDYVSANQITANLNDYMNDYADEYNDYMADYYD